MHRNSLKPKISRHTSHLMKEPNCLKNKRSSYDVECELKIRRMEQKIEQAAGVNLGCYEKDTFQPRYFSRIQKYFASTRKSPSIPGIMFRQDEVASNTVDIWEHFKNFLIGVSSPSVLSDTQINLESGSLNTLLIAKADMAKILKPELEQILLQNIVDEVLKLLKLFL